jgi:hypothetical protein
MTGTVTIGGREFRVGAWYMCGTKNPEPVQLVACALSTPAGGWAPRVVYQPKQIGEWTHKVTVPIADWLQSAGDEVAP